MKKIIISFAIAFTASQGLAQTADLMQVYLQAVRSDATFQQAYADYQVAQQNVPLSRANLLPQINLTGGIGYEYQNSTIKNPRTSGGTATPGYSDFNDRFKTGMYNLTLTQSVFNFTDWENLASAHASTKAAFATYSAAIQTLIVNTSQAYFNVLQARDTLSYSKAETRAFYRQYMQAKESYEVGVKTLTDVENAKAAYDTGRSEVVAAENNLLNKREDLRVITGIYYSQLSTLKQLPLIKPQPANINAWVKTSEQKNWSIMASRLSLLSSHYDISSAEGGHMPTVALDANYQGTYNNNINRDAYTHQQQFVAGLNVTMPIYSGGQVSATVDQNIAKYRLASAQLVQTYRDTLNSTRQSFLGALSGISKVRADYQAIISNESSLKGTEEGYKVGTQTMLNVLTAEKNLYQAKRQYSIDRYAYVMSLIQLKQGAGTLDVQDVALVNRWLHYGRLAKHHKTVRLNSHKAKAKHHRKLVKHQRKTVKSKRKTVSTKRSA